MKVPFFLSGDDVTRLRLALELQADTIAEAQKRHEDPAMERVFRDVLALLKRLGGPVNRRGRGAVHRGVSDQPE